MLRRLVIVSMCLIAMALAHRSTGAEPPPAAGDLVVKPGDTIEFASPSPHRLRFGGSVQNAADPTGPAIQLTPWIEVEKIFTFTPALTVNAGIAMGAPGQTVTATVKETASAGATFVFTCGQHPPAMLSLPLTVAAKEGTARELKIRAANLFKWLLKKADGTEVQIDTTP
jgi:hypothetical protein